MYVYPQVKEKGRKKAPAHAPACVNMVSPAV